MTPTLNWQPQITAITNKIYASQQLEFSQEIFKCPAKKAAYPISCTPSDKTRTGALQTTQNACIRFIFGHPSYLVVRLKPTPIHLQDRRLARQPPQDFEQMVPQKSACKKSFTITAMKFMNSLVITEFNSGRQNKFNSWCFQLFLLLEIDAWQIKCSLKSYVSQTAVSSLPRPTLPFNISAFTFTSNHLNTPGHSLQEPFVNILPSSHL